MLAELASESRGEFLSWRYCNVVPQAWRCKLAREISNATRAHRCLRALPVLDFEAFDSSQ